MRDAVLAVFAFALGAIVGSFLNACIYRMPRGIRLDQPRRSFCPECKVTIPWYLNLPLTSWLWLRGRCASCGARIPFRYFLVELLTAAVFLFLWLKFGFPLAVAYWAFAALLIAATFIDFEHFIIPDEITIGGTALGIASSALIPQMMGADSWWAALLWSAGAAAIGYGALWLVVEVGKVAFGKKRVRLPKTEPFQFQPDPERPALKVGDEVWPWDEIFSRITDELVLECKSAALNGEPVKDPTFRIRYDRVIADGKEIPIEEIKTLSGKVNAVVIPREAMGFGDVKFIACIGAFLGWKAVLFTLFSSSVIGALVGGIALLVTRGKSGSKIPFGPYLALGAFLWLVLGPELWDWYFGMFGTGLPS